MRRWTCLWVPTALWVLFLWLCGVLPGAAQPNVIVWGTSSYWLTNVPADFTNAVAASAGYTHCVALKADGTVAAWGSGQGTNVPPGLTNIVAVAAGQYFSLALNADGTVTGWGLNPSGQATPPAGLDHVVAISAGLYQARSWLGVARRVA